MTTIEAAPALAPEQMRRRVDDLPLPSRPLTWEDRGTPIEGTVVYQYHPRAERFARWADIETREQLLDVQAQPERFEVRILFAASVEALARSPLAMIAAAQTRLDQVNKFTGAAIANARSAVTNMQAAMAATREEL